MARKRQEEVEEEEEHEEQDGATKRNEYRSGLKCKLRPQLNKNTFLPP